jgi:hypothetical protein
MTLADVYEHNAKECREAAERTYNATHRAMLLKTAREWWQDAEAVRGESTSSDFCCQASIEEIEAAENAFPRSFLNPRAASSAEISRNDCWPPFGRRRRS